ncbi:MAG: lytic transglycosylase domain-containing protein [Spirochaetes bacterium]|nr:lytic transglycosylase domain-containing protein [Spirochaetota bacterium]
MLTGIENVISRMHSIQKRISDVTNLHNPYYKKVNNNKNPKKNIKINTTLKKINNKNDIKNISSQSIKANLKYGPEAFDKFIKNAAKKHNLPFALIKAVIRQESNFNPNAVSSKGASGLMQLMPGTAKLLNVSSIFNPRQNINGGSKYLKDMMLRYNGNLSKALGAYNAGPEAVDKNNGVPNYKETKDFIKKVLQYYSKFS